ncbi:hypothetical protein [Paenibacillus sp. NPDC058071]|uniref:hypothetical protein n=1 Tax=Paenibacillus sp. NPDC058071 TaxID=3346326 RepID=UPI0036DC01F7
MTPTALSLTGGSKEPLKISFDDNYGITLTSHKKLTLSAADEISLFTPKRIIISTQSQILARKGNLPNGLVMESEYHIAANKVIAAGSDRTGYIVYNDGPTEDTADKEAAAKEAEAATKKKGFNWKKLAVVAGAALAIVAVAAVVIVSGGAAVPLIAAAAPMIAMAAASAVGGLAATYISDLQSGEDSSIGTYIWNTSAAIVGALTGALFGPALLASTATASLVPMTTSQVMKTQVMTMLTGGAAVWTDYTLYEALTGKMPRWQEALKSFVVGTMFTGYFIAFAPFASKAFSRISSRMRNKWGQKPTLQTSESEQPKTGEQKPQTSTNNGPEQPKPGETNKVREEPAPEQKKRADVNETEGMGDSTNIPRTGPE